MPAELELVVALLQDQQTVAFEGQKLHGPETRYSATEQELLGVIFSLKKWRSYLEGTRMPFVMVLTMHQTHASQSNQSSLQGRPIGLNSLPPTTSCGSIAQEKITSQIS